MYTKEAILKEIRRTAKENDGKPLGMARFEKETGLKPHHWKKYWARFGDLQKEAGFEPNQLQGSYDDEFLIGKLIKTIRKLGKFPTFDELNIERSSDSKFPSREVFTKFGKLNLVGKIVEYCKDKGDYSDVIELCAPILKKYSNKNNYDGMNTLQNVGEVYLFKSGRYYKIGKTNDTVRRGSELRIQLPEEMNLIHSIKTDDPSGIEAYWHRRFESKRMNGEWFNLTSADIRAFKRWRKIV